MPDRIREKYPDRVYRIPMTGPVRSLNLATAVGIVLYDVLKQLDYGKSSEFPTYHRPRAGAKP